MSTYDLQLSAQLLPQPHTASPLTISARLDRLQHALRQRLSEWKYRRSLQNLHRLSDRVLEDIGMTRGELSAALQLPLSVNAHQVLTEWRAERRITG